MLEQLRALEHGARIYVLQTDQVSTGVDVPADVALVERLLREQEKA
jgi:CMP-2-keto-3-deoxyoctulosonic acid synthetase